MTPDWKDISSAPLGSYRIQRAGKNGTCKFHIPEMVMTGRVGEKETRPSYYIPDQDRWNFYTKENGPTHWDHMPEGPK
ncbi:hypothetical protein [Thalassospira marina]|uniref:Uncharacterized protein n=1 Tax=Thalassospira marina TaxID=2048283 RepID=A0A2N3KXZ5_9PROT|nr:hypothetical protein [Thalassospira marina]PKR55441.1 hypothetical protein COO20_04530 [Thalassospira marina]